MFSQTMEKEMTRSFLEKKRKSLRTMLKVGVVIKWFAVGAAVFIGLSGLHLLYTGKYLLGSIDMLLVGLNIWNYYQMKKSISGLTETLLSIDTELEKLNAVA